MYPAILNIIFEMMQVKKKTVFRLYGKYNHLHNHINVKYSDCMENMITCTTILM